ncbi:MAG: HNH endonuclease signature motif containing protein [Tetrasphaera sp.]
MPAPSPLDFDIRTPAAMQSWNTGFTRALPEEGAWLPFQSTRSPATIWIAARKEGTSPAPVEWFLALDHAAALQALSLPAAPVPGPGLARISLPSTLALFETLSRLYPLIHSLPFSLAATFAAATANLPATTEAERLTIQRIGQDLFRDALMRQWNARCPLTGITDPALLRASHIKPWADCTTDAERLDPMNGLLLSALWDAAFDRGLVSFADTGAALYSETLSAEARILLPAKAQLPLPPPTHPTSPGTA